MKCERGGNEDAVSPVVGVMLMLVVTIIIAAVVSALAGGLMGGSSQKSPMLSMDIAIRNTGSWVGSGFTATVTSTSEPISTDKLKISTSWRTTNKSTEDREPLNGGGTCIGQAVNLYINSSTSPVAIIDVPPYGFGSGVKGDTQNISYPYSGDQQFGSYTLVQGTGLFAKPSGAVEGDEDAVPGTGGTENDYGYGIGGKPYEYTRASDGSTGHTGFIGKIGGMAGSDFTGKVDSMQALLGLGWENLRAGDIVSVSVVHVPTGKVILTKNIVVTD